MKQVAKKIKRTIQLGSQKFQVINLTEPLMMETEVFPGDPGVEREIFCTIEEKGCLYYIHRLGDHLFHPHGDAPNHQNPEYSDRGYEYWGLDYAFNDALLINLSDASGARDVDGVRFLTKVSARHLKPFLDIMQTKTAVVIRTGYDCWLSLNRKHDPELIPCLDEDAGMLLSSMENLRVIGTDSLTIDRIGVNICHRLLRDKFLVECMVNLDQIPEHAHFDFHLQTSPIAVVGATGGPVAAYAFVLNEQGETDE